MSSPGFWQRSIKRSGYTVPNPLWVTSSTQRRKTRRAARKHAAKMFAAGCPEKAAVWLKRARNG